MSPEDRERFEKLEPGHQSAIIILQALLEHHTPPGSSSKNLNPKVAVEACMMVAAALIEIGPDAETTKGLRENLTWASDLMKTLAKSFRRDFEDTGRRGLEQLGAVAVTRSAIN